MGAGSSSAPTVAGVRARPSSAAMTNVRGFMVMLLEGMIAYRTATEPIRTLPGEHLDQPARPDRQVDSAADRELVEVFDSREHVGVAASRTASTEWMN
jgi:hypothetical protein